MMDYAKALQEGVINKGDVLTFGTEPMRWIVTSVEVKDGKIIGYLVRPQAGSTREELESQEFQRTRQ